MPWLRQSTITSIAAGPFVDPTDGFTLKTGLVSALDHATTGIKLSKHGGSLAVRHATVTATTYDSGGYGTYDVTLDATDTNTLGRLRAIFAGNTTCNPWWRDFLVVPANTWDSLILGTDFINADVMSINGVTGDAALLAALVEAGIIGTVTATGGDATHFQCSDITEATANHYVGKQAWVTSGTLIKQCFGVILAYTLTGGQGRFTVQGSPTGETIATGAKVWIY